MKREELNSKAEQGRLRAQELRHARLSREPVVFAHYLWHRNRFPILTKVVTRLLIILEVYLLYLHGSYSLASEVSFVVHNFLLISLGLVGIAQGERVWQAQNSLRSLDQRNKHLTQALAAALITSAVVVGGAILLFDFQGAALWLMLLGFLLVPLELLETITWGVLYTEQRHPRSLFVVLSLRALPALSIITLYPLLGPLSFLLGVAVSRCAEAIYLSRLAAKAIGLDLASALPRVKFLAGLTWLKDNFGYLTAPLSQVMFQAVIAWAIFSREEQIWLVAFGFFQVLNLITYVAQRPAYSLAFDLYLSIRAGAIRSSARYRRLMGTWAVLGLFIAIMFVILALVIFLDIFVYLFPDLLQLAPWLVILALVRVGYAVRFSLLRSMGSDNQRSLRVLLVFVVLGGPLIYWVAFFERGNLPAIFLVDAIIHFVALIALGRIDPTKAAFWPPTLANPSSNPYRYLVALAGKPNHGVRIELVNKITELTSSYPVELCRNLILVSSAYEPQQFFCQLWGSLAAQILAATEVKYAEQPSFRHFLDKIKNSRDCHSVLRRIADLWCKGLQAGLPELEALASKLPRVEFSQGREHLTGKLTDPAGFYHFLNRCDRSRHKLRLSAVVAGRYLPVYEEGFLRMLVDATSANNQELETLKIALASHELRTKLFN